MDRLRLQANAGHIMEIDLRYGDAVEMTNTEWIRANVPEYEHLWSRFIGHDGTGRALPLDGLTCLSSEDRERFFQAHYSVLLCLLALRDLANEYQRSLGLVQNVEAYLKATRDTLSFVAHLGRLRDLFKKMDGALKLRDSLWRQFDDFYSRRNSYLHGPTPAHRFVDGLIKIPIPSGRDAADSKWTDESRWTNARTFTYQFVSDFFQNTTIEAIGLTRSGISQCITRLNELEPTFTKPMQVTFAPSIIGEGVSPMDCYIPYSGTGPLPDERNDSALD